jgi:hypothetical protein
MHTIVAAFRNASAGRSAAHSLRSAGFTRVNAERLRAVLREGPSMRESGVRSKYEFFLEEERASPFARLVHLLGGASGRRPAYTKLVRLGISDRAARAAVEYFVDNGLLLTIESDGQRERIRSLVEAARGRVVAGMPALPTISDDFVAMPPKSGVARARETGTNTV